MKTFYIIGNPIEHSLSPKLFLHIFNRLDIKARYLPYMPLNDNTLITFLENNIDNFSGANITLPFKINAFNLVHSNDMSSKNIKSVNCIKNVNNKLIGYNTDSYAFNKMINNIDLNLDNHSILVLGNGGTSRTVVHSLLNRTKNKIFIWGRNKKRVDSFIEEINSNQIKYFNQNFNKPLVVINCLSLNIDENSIQTILSYIPINSVELFIDLNYCETQFSKKLIGKKCNVILGLDMFIFQALKSFDIWFDNQYHNKISFQEVKALLNK